VILRIYEKKMDALIPWIASNSLSFFWGNTRSCSTLHRIIRRDL